jgi:hypothetical protein
VNVRELKVDDGLPRDFDFDMAADLSGHAGQVAARSNISVRLRRIPRRSVISGVPRCHFGDEDLTATASPSRGRPRERRAWAAPRDQLRRPVRAMTGYQNRGNGKRPIGRVVSYSAAAVERL